MARSGLAACVGKSKSAGWRKVGAAYRVVLFGAGGAKQGGKTPDGFEKRRRGFTQRQIYWSLAIPYVVHYVGYYGEEARHRGLEKNGSELSCIV